MGKRICDFHAVWDAERTLRLPADDESEQTFRLSKEFDNGSDTILMWRIRTEDNSRNIRYRVRVNNSVVFTQPSGGRIDGESYQTVHEVAGRGVFNPGNREQRLQVELLGGSGFFGVADVVVLYQREI